MRWCLDRQWLERELEDSDGALLMLNGEQGVGPGDRFIAGALRGAGVPVIIAVNKVDRLDRAHTLQVLSDAAALEVGDLPAAGQLLFSSHASLRDDYEVSTPELDLLVDLARDAGAFGARLLGGGFGGAILALTDVARADEVAATVSSSYRRRTGRGGASLIAVASAGANVSS